VETEKETTMSAPEFDAATRTELEAAAFRRLVAHLRERSDVQNIDMMNLAGFCRNCLSRWYREEAATKGITIADPDAREIVYGMPYKEWQAKHQVEASTDQKAAFAKANPGH
jgi:uncharacterized protein